MIPVFLPTVNVAYLIKGKYFFQTVVEHVLNNGKHVPNNSKHIERDCLIDGINIRSIAKLIYLIKGNDIISDHWQIVWRINGTGLVDYSVVGVLHVGVYCDSYSKSSR